MADKVKNRIKLTAIQRLIGERMLNSKSTKPCFYLESRADITEMMGMRPKLRKTLGVKITTNTFYIHALAAAAAKYPLMVGRLKDGNIKIADAINVGFAVNAPHGLVVPVIKNANKKTLAEIASEENFLTNQARSNKLTLEQLESETIALSNLGTYGINSFIAIIPPQASAILAVGNITREICTENSETKICKKVSLSLAADHRIINGAYAAKFLRLLKEVLQNPLHLTT